MQTYLHLHSHTLVHARPNDRADHPESDAQRDHRPDKDDDAFSTAATGIRRWCCYRGAEQAQPSPDMVEFWHWHPLDFFRCPSLNQLSEGGARVSTTTNGGLNAEDQ